MSKMQGHAISNMRNFQRRTRPFTLKVQEARQQLGVIGEIGCSIEHSLVKIGTAQGAKKWLKAKRKLALSRDVSKHLGTFRFPFGPADVSSLCR